MGQFVESSISDGVARITLNRPNKRNALTRAMIGDLVAAVDELHRNDKVRILILQANGKVFCAGMDLGEMQQRAASDNAEAEWQRDSEIYAELLCKIYELPVPTISAVQGAALAGGLGLVLSCDMTIAAQSAFFSLPEPARGITAAMVTPLLAHRCGYGTARALLLSLQRCSADRAAELGLVHSVVDDEALPGNVDELVSSALAGSPAALAITKAHIDRCAGGQVTAQIRESVTVSATARQTEDAREGLQAFLEKRQPNWKSR
jgi:methylglutaconyl-CoA hydratase